MLALTGRRFMCTYFAQLDAEYEALCPDDFKKTTQENVDRLRAEHLRRPSWHLNHRYEYLLLRGLPDAVISQRALLYQARLLALLGVDENAPIAKAFAIHPDCPPEERRVQLLGIMTEIQRLRHVRTEFERLRHRLFSACIAMGALCLTFALTAASGHFPVMQQIHLHVVAGGVLGAFFSVLLRFGGLRWCLDYNANYQQVDRLFWNLCVSFGLALFEGAVAAFLLYGLFVSGMLSGEVFPDFGTVREQTVRQVSDLFDMRPVAAGETVKLFVWCVVAGFSERLVPDLLGNFGEEARKRREATAAQAGVAASKPMGEAA